MSFSRHGVPFVSVFIYRCTEFEEEAPLTTIDTLYSYIYIISPQTEE